MTKYKVGITFGTFDLLHIGHIRILKNAATLCEKLVVGISTDNLNFIKKNTYPVYSQDDRAEIIKSITYVHSVFFEESLEQKVNYIKQHDAEILVMGKDWEGKFDFCKDICDVYYLPRTENISTTSTIHLIKTNI